MSLIGGCHIVGDSTAPSTIEAKLAGFQLADADGPDVYTVDFYHCGSAAVFSKGRKGVQSFVESRKDRSGNVLLVLGYLAPPDGLFGNGPSDAPFEKDLPERIQRADGEFTCVLLEPSEERVHLITDRYGARPCYVVRKGGNVWFCTNLHFLMQMTGQSFGLDASGLLQLFSLGHTLEQRTTVEGVERMRPASHWILEGQTVKERQYWRLRYEPDHDLDPDRYASEVYGAFREGMASRVRMLKNGMLTLSGGMDSRFMVGGVPEDARLPVFTFSDSVESLDTAEVQFARRVAQEFGLEHCVRQIPVGEVSGVVSDLASWIGGLYPIQHAVRSMQASKLGCDSMFSGAPGDEVSGDLVRCLADLDPRRAESAVDRWILARQKLRREHLEILFRPAFLEPFHPQVHRAFQQSFEGVSGPSGGHRISAWMMSKFWPTFTFANPYHCMPNCTQIRPHLCYGFVDRMLRLPASWLYDRAFYKYMLYTQLPGLRDVPNSNTGEVLTGALLPSRVGRGFFLRDLLKRKSVGAWRKALRLSGLRRPIRRPSGFVQQTDMADAQDNALLRNDGQLIERMKELLHSYDELTCWFDRVRCDQFLEDYRCGVVRTGWVRNDNLLFGSLASTLFFYDRMRRLECI